MVLRITQLDKERKTFPLAQIVGRTGIKWDTEVPVDKGWIDIHVPVQHGIEHPYAIEVQTGYDLNCSGILQKLERFRTAMTIEAPIAGSETTGFKRFTPRRIGLEHPEKIHPKLCVVIPKDFAEFIPLLKSKEISVFLWEGTLEWECKKCNEITLGSGPWKPVTCDSNSCNGKERSFRLIGLADFEIRRAD